MLNVMSSLSRWLVISVVFGMFAAFSGPVFGQESPAVHVGSEKITGVPDDWTHHHVVFSDPGTEQEAIRAGRHERWRKIVNNERYVVQQLKKNLPVHGPSAVDADYRARWIAEAYGVGGAESRRAEDARRDSGSWRRARRRINHWEKEADLPSNIKRDWSMPLGGPGLAAGHFPAKYSFTTSSASCSDYVVYPTGAAGTASQATVVAFTNIYVGAGGCAASSPTVYWAYNTPPGGITADSATANLSPVLSIDGKQVAFVETYSGTGYLVLLTMANSGGTVASPAAIQYVTNANYHGCVGVSGGAPCYTTISLGAADTDSAPYYDYGGTDTLYVGDDSGKVHKIAGAFGGTPVLDSVTGWPVTASTETSHVLNSPVYDSTSGNIFVGDSGGYLHQFAVAGPGTVNTSGRLENNSVGVFDSPIVDSTTELVYTFIGYSGDSGNNHPSYINRFAANTAIASFGTGLPFGNGGTTTNPTTSIMRSGAYDYQYALSDGVSGHFYSCANGHVFQITITGTTNMAVAPFSTPVSALATCSAVTEFVGVKANTTLSAATPSTSTTTTLSAAINHASNPGTTTLSVADSSGQSYICVASRSNISAGDYVQVDSERMWVTSTSGRSCSRGREVQVDPGVAGTTASGHSNGATVSILSNYITVPTGAGVTVGNYIQVDSEDMLVTATYTGAPGLTLAVTRGQLGTTAATHASGATVTVLPQFNIASSTGISAGDYLQVDSEIVSVASVLSGTSLLVTRAQLGTSAAAHANGAAVQDLRDGLFMSVAGSGNAAGCTGACVFSYDVISGAATGTPTAGLPESGGTSGIVIDNQSTTQVGAQQIYFSTLTGHTAVQASQAGLN